MSGSTKSSKGTVWALIFFLACVAFVVLGYMQ